MINTVVDYHTGRMTRGLYGNAEELTNIKDTNF